MRLLFLLPSVPDPPDAGAKLRNLGLLKVAAASHEVDAIAFGQPDELPRLDSLARRAVVVEPPPRRSAPERLAGLAGSPLPDVAARLWSTTFLTRLHDLLVAEAYDAVQAEGLEMARYLRAVLPRDPAVGRPWRVYDAHNAEFLLQRRAYEAARSRRAFGGAVPAAYSLAQWKRLAAFEGEVVRAARLVLAVSHHDANQLEALAPGSTHVRVVPNAVALESYPFQPPQADDPPHLLFVGKLDYRPNQEALAWLTRDVLPPLFERRPDTRLLVVGHDPPDWLVALGQRDARVVVTGGVPDERPYFQRSALLVLPLLAGGGSRLKALVAFALGLPVLSTRLGMEGLDAEPGRDFLAAESAAEWVETIDAALRDAALRASLAASGRRTVEQRYNWSTVAPALRDAYAALEPSDSAARQPTP